MAIYATTINPYSTVSEAIMHKAEKTQASPIWKVVPVKLSVRKSRSKWTQQLNLFIPHLSPLSQTNQAKKKKKNLDLLPRSTSLLQISSLPHPKFILQEGPPSQGRCETRGSANRRNTNTEEELFLPMGTLWSLTPRESAECHYNKLVFK